MLAEIKTTLTCDTIVPLTDFDLEKFAGVWIEQQHVYDPQEPEMYQCSTASYTDLDYAAEEDGQRQFKVYNSFQSKALGLWTPRIGVHAKAHCGTDGACYVSFFGAAVPEPNLHVLETDYTGYAINYSCNSGEDVIQLWLNTREANITDEYFQMIYDRAMELLPNFDTSTLQPRLTQGDMCSYPKVNSPSYVERFLATVNI